MTRAILFFKKSTPIVSESQSMIIMAGSTVAGRLGDWRSSWEPTSVPQLAQGEGAGEMAGSGKVFWSFQTYSPTSDTHTSYHFQRVPLTEDQAFQLEPMRVMVVYDSKPITQQTETKGFNVQGQAELHSKTCLEKKKIKPGNFSVDCGPATRSQAYHFIFETKLNWS